MNEAQEEKLRHAVKHLLEDANIGDFIYEIRDRERQDWHGPKVTAYQDALTVLADFVNGKLK